MVGYLLLIFYLTLPYIAHVAFSEEKLRYEIFKNNMMKVQQLQNHERGSATYGATKFADMTGKLAHLIGCLTTTKQRVYQLLHQCSVWMC